MRVIDFSNARNQLKQVIDQVVEDADFTVIARRDAQDAVVVSLDTFNSLMDTLHLMKSPANAKHLEKSITQHRKGQKKIKGLVDANSMRTKPVWTKAAESHKPILISGRRTNAVLVSEEDWSAIQETLCILAVPGMRESIKGAMAEPRAKSKKALKW
jgi:antitoxin YefM